MKNIQNILLLSAVIGLSACGKVTVETAEDFKQVELPDSSIVYLNHNSKLTYDEDFSPRKVKLEGEAFFSVNDGETPFVIETEAGEEVTVLGTEFNLVASITGVAIEVEIGIVSLRIFSGDIYKEVRRGQRIDFNRHDNGLHLGHAKRQHRNWIRLMDKDFKKSGLVLKRSKKHTMKSSPKGSKKIFKGGKSKGNEGSKAKGSNKAGKSKADGKGSNDGGKNSKGGDDKGGKGGKGKN